MLRITEYEGPDYFVRGQASTRKDYIKLEWDKGYLQMTKHAWNKLSKKQKDLVYRKGLGR